MNKKELLVDWRKIKFLQNMIICESCSGGILGEPLRIIPLFGTGTQEWIQPIPVDGFNFHPGINIKITVLQILTGGSPRTSNYSLR